MKGIQLTYQHRLGVVRLIVTPDELPAIVASIFRTYSYPIQVVLIELD